MMPNETVELAALERAIRSVEPTRAPIGLRAALRSDLTRAAGARTASWLAPLAAAQRLAFAAIVALLLMGGIAVAASAPGDLAYPIKDAIVRLFVGSMPSENVAPSAPQFAPIDPTIRPMSSEVPAPAPAPGASGPPALPLAPAAPMPQPGQTTLPATPAASAAPTVSGPPRATPAVTPDPAGPRATPAVPPQHP
jgi:hypothetical protein